MRFVCGILLLSFALPSHSQFIAKLGLEYRITPIDLVGVNRTPVVPQSRDELLSGPGLKLNLEAYLLSRLSLNFTTHFRYDHLIYEQYVDSIFLVGVGKSVQNLFIDYQFSVNYWTEIRKDNRLYFGLGAALMGRESEYHTTSIVMINNVPTLLSADGNFDYEALSLNMGFEFKDKLCIGLVLYFIPSHKFIGAETLMIPALDIQYCIIKF